MILSVLTQFVTTNALLHEIPENNGAMHVTQKELTVSKDENERLGGSRSLLISTGKLLNKISQ